MARHLLRGLALTVALPLTAIGYQNPIGVGAHAKDPSVLVEAGTHYVFTSFTGDAVLAGNVPLQQSPDLVNWEYLGDALPTLPAWVDPADAEVRGPATLTRPSLGRYLLFFSARHRDDGTAFAGSRCIGVVASAALTMLLDGSPSLIPADQPLVCHDDADAFDPFVFTAPAPTGDPYAWLVWAEHRIGEPDVILHALLTPDGADLAISAFTLLTAETVPDLWEQGQLANPAIVKDSGSGKYFLFYTGNEDFYSVDQPDVVSPPNGAPGISGTNWATCTPSYYGIFLPCQRNDRRPWLQAQNGAWRPGDADFFRDAGGALWMLYNASNRVTFGVHVYLPPTLRLDRVCISADGKPRTTGPTTTPQSLARSADCAQDVQLVAEPWPEADTLFFQDPRWRGADGGWTVDLGDERTLWMFGDTFIDPEGETRIGANFIRNSIAIQQGDDPSTAQMTFHWKTTPQGAPTAFFPSSGGVWYWAGGGAIVGNKLVIFQGGNRLDGGSVVNAPPKGVVVANHQDDPSLWNQQWFNIPITQANSLYCSGHYAFVSGSYVYVYVTRDVGAQYPDAVLCRYQNTQAKNGNFTKPQWWTGQEYNVNGQPASLWSNSAQYSVHRLPSGEHIAIMGSPFPGFGRFATSPDRNGPFSPFALFYDPPEAHWYGPNGGTNTYIYQAHPELTGAPVVVTYSTHGSNILLSDESPYYPKFVRFTPP